MERFLTSPEFWAAVAAVSALIPFFWNRFIEKRSTNKAILAEVGRLLTVIKRHRDFWQKCITAKATGHHPLISFSHPVYDKQIKNVGVIRGKQVAHVVAFYGFLDYLNRFQALREKYDAAGNGDEFNDMYVGALTRIIEDCDHVSANVFNK